MPSERPEMERHQKVLEEHRQLRELLGKIDRVLQERKETIAEAGKLLGELGDRLVKHFTLEEEGGYFGETLLQAPRLVARANELLAQHPKMCTQATELCEVAASPENADDWWDKTSQRFQAFKKELLAHERKEDSLLQEAYQQDLGTHD